MASTVTIDRSYFETLVSSARQYANLRRNLFRGGIAEETLALLVKDDGTPAESASITVQSKVDEIASTKTSIIRPIDSASNYDGRPALLPRNRNTFDQINRNPREQKYPTHRRDSVLNISSDDDYMPEAPANELFEDDTATSPQISAESAVTWQRPTFARHANRSLQLFNVPEGTTHADITDAIRGGQILDIFFRPHERIFHVSFVEGSAAQEFYRHVKRNDLYIKGKRVDIRWNERQLVLADHVARNIKVHGATRNLVILNRSPHHTEDRIRQDLDHIHNLTVIRVTIKETKVHISTNSVHNAMYARTCMSSRTAYRGTKIAWDIDECAVRYEKPVVRHDAVPTTKENRLDQTFNRFQVLNIDNTDETPADEESRDYLSNDNLTTA